MCSCYQGLQGHSIYTRIFSKAPLSLVVQAELQAAYAALQAADERAAALKAQLEAAPIEAAAAANEKASVLPHRTDAALHLESTNKLSSS